MAVFYRAELGAIQQFRRYASPSSKPCSLIPVQCAIMKLASYNTDDLPQVCEELRRTPWLVACLCAAWCRTCDEYRPAFDALRAQHPDKCLAWLDVEDQAALVDEVDVENFPTILIQHEDKVLFLGTMLPDVQQLHRLISSLSANLTSTPTAKPSQIPAEWSLRRLLLQSA